MRFLGWDEFNECISFISTSCANKSLSGVYGFPRGGLCLAVALSHSLGITLLEAPQPDCLVVDDIYETGLTLQKVRSIPGVSSFVWLSKVEPDWWNSVEIVEPNEWFVFPWENKELAHLDQDLYYMSHLNIHTKDRLP